MNNILSLVKAWEDSQRADTPSVLATVLRVSGSHYRRPGARMFAALPKDPVGSVSGGCLESDIMTRAAMVIQTGNPVLVHYDTTSDSDLLFGTGMGCGGEVDILIESANSASVKRLMEYSKICVNTRRPLGIATVFGITGEIDVRAGDRVVVCGDDADIIGISAKAVRTTVLCETRRVIESRQNRVEQFTSTHGFADVFLEFVPAPISLGLFGAGDDARPVCAFASRLGWQVTVIDHRSARLTEQRFPEATVFHLCRAEEIGEIEGIGAFDAAVVMTHNYQYDRELLKTLLAHKSAYIGLLGAAKRSERILKDLETDGMTINDQVRGRLYAPVGLDLNADGAEEIALAIVSEIQMVLNGGSGRSKRSRRILVQTPRSTEVA